jgi:hypothetical protein
VRRYGSGTYFAKITLDEIIWSHLWALAAIEQRRLSPIEPDGDEDRALKNADAGIKALIAERTDSDS